MSAQKVQAALNENEFTLRIAQLIAQAVGDDPTPGKKKRMGHEALMELAKEEGVEISNLKLSSLNKLGGNEHFCAEDGEIIDEKTLWRYVRQIPKNMDALKSEDLDHIILELHYITMEAHENPGRKEALDKMNTEEEMNAFHAEIAIPQDGEGVKKAELLELSKDHVSAVKKSAGDLISAVSGSAAATNETGLITSKEMKLAHWKTVFESHKLLNGDIIEGVGDDQTLFKASKSAFRIQRKQTATDYLYGGDSTDPTTEQMPAFRPVHEKSITIEEITTELQRNLANSGFSKASLSVAIGATFEAFSGSVKAGITAQESSSSGKSGEQSTKEIVGNWNAPQVEVTLDRNNMILSPDCKAALDKIIKNEKHGDVVRFLKDYGTIFAQRVVLGGRLTTRQIMTTTASAEAKGQKRELQASMEAKIGAPMLAKGSVKATYGSGTDTAEKSSNSNSSTSLAWQAQGGDTDLAQSPNAWLPTVKDYNTWYPIMRDNVLPMDQMIAGFEGYEKIPKIFLDILGRVNKEEESSVTSPWSQLLARDISGPKKLVGHAIDSFTGHLKTSPFETPEWSDLSQPKQEPDPAVSWKTFRSAEDIRKEVFSTLTENSGIEARVNAIAVPGYLYSFQASDRTLSVMMKWVSSPRVRKTPIRMLRLTEAAAAAISIGDATFFQNHGDRFVSGWTEQATVVAIWTLEASRRGNEFTEWSNKITEYFKDTKNLQEGCDFLRDLGANFFVDIFKSNSESDTIILAKGHVRPNEVFANVDGLKETDYIPTSIQLMSYDTIYPSYKSPAPELPVNRLKKVRDLFQRNIMLHVGSKASPFRKDSPQETELRSQVWDLRSKLEQGWDCFVIGAQGADDMKNLESRHTENENQVMMRFCARDWIRKSMDSEDKDEAMSGRRFNCTKNIGLSDLSSYDFEPQIIELVRNRLVTFECRKEWTFDMWSRQDDQRTFEIDQHHGHYLVAYQMHNMWNNSDTNGEWWIEHNNKMAVARHNLRIFHEKRALRGYCWVLHSWWLPRDQFPFIDEELYA